MHSELSENTISASIEAQTDVDEFNKSKTFLAVYTSKALNEQKMLLDLETMLDRKALSLSLNGIFPDDILTMFAPALLANNTLRELTLPYNIFQKNFNLILVLLENKSFFVIQYYCNSNEEVLTPDDEQKFQKKLINNGSTEYFLIKNDLSECFKSKDKNIYIIKTILNLLRFLRQYSSIIPQYILEEFYQLLKEHENVLETMFNSDLNIAETTDDGKVTTQQLLLLTKFVYQMLKSIVIFNTDPKKIIPHLLNNFSKETLLKFIVACGAPFGGLDLQRALIEELFKQSKNLQEAETLFGCLPTQELCGRGEVLCYLYNLTYKSDMFRWTAWRVWHLPDHLIDYRSQYELRDCVYWHYGKRAGALSEKKLFQEMQAEKLLVRLRPCLLDAVIFPQVDQQTSDSEKFRILKQATYSPLFKTDKESLKKLADKRAAVENTTKEFDELMANVEKTLSLNKKILLLMTAAESEKWRNEPLKLKRINEQCDNYKQTKFEILLTLPQTFQTAKTSHQLTLDHSQFWAMDMEEVLNQLTSNPEILVLDLSRVDGITSKDTILLAEGIEKNKYLEKIKLNKTIIDYQSIQALIKLTQQNSTIIAIEFSNNGFMDRIIDRTSYDTLDLLLVRNNELKKIMASYTLIKNKIIVDLDTILATLNTYQQFIITYQNFPLPQPLADSLHRQFKELNTSITTIIEKAMRMVIEEDPLKKLQIIIYGPFATTKGTRLQLIVNLFSLQNSQHIEALLKELLSNSIEQHFYSTPSWGSTLFNKVPKELLEEEKNNKENFRQSIKKILQNALLGKDEEEQIKQLTEWLNYTSRSNVIAKEEIKQLLDTIQQNQQMRNTSLNYSA